MVEVNYPIRLVRLVREVQQLSVMGLNIPKSIRDVSDRAIKFMNQAKDLEQVILIVLHIWNSIFLKRNLFD